MEIDLFVCSYSNSVDFRTNAVSIFNIVDGLNAPSFPCLLGPISIAVMLSRDAGEPDISLRLKITLGDVVLADGPIDIEFGEHLKTRTFAEIGGLVIQSPGMLKFALIKDSAEWGIWKVPVTDVGPQITQSPGIQSQDVQTSSSRKVRVRRKTSASS